VIRRLLTNPTVRGLALVALVAFVIVLFSLEESLATAGALLRIAFFLAIAFFLFLLWRERRADIDTWSERGRRTFYGAIALAVLDIGMLIALGPSGLEAVAGIVVLLACAWAIVRVWRQEHRYS
jgi:hypothetical protein